MSLTLFLTDGRARALDLLRQIALCCSDVFAELALRVSPRWLTTNRPPMTSLSNGIASLLQQTDLHVDAGVLLFTLALLTLLALAVHLSRTSDRRIEQPVVRIFFHPWSLQ